MYRHGVYSEQIPFAGNIATKALGTIPVYVGTAPVQQINTEGLADFDYSGLINTPILIESLADAKAKIGYSDSWDKYTLGEAIKAHFDNGVTAIGPIVVINISNPELLESTDTTTDVTLSGAAGNKVGYIMDPQAAIKNVTVTAVTTITESDYSIEYEGDTIKITITKAEFADTTVTATYKRVDVSDTALTPTMFDTALSALDVVEISCGVIPNILAAPGYSGKPLYHEKMMSKALARISQKWYISCVSDIPSDSNDTVAKTISWKENNGYTSKLDKVCWPMAKFGDKQYHLSTLAVVTIQQQDTDADGIPYISPSNKGINASSVILKSGNAIAFDEVTANSLNKVGITTTNLVRGSIRLWGPHMANYNYDSLDNIKPEDRTDSSIRMMQYLLNTLQYNYLDSVDKPFSKRDIDSIKASVQQWLNGLVNEGKLLYANIQFAESNTVGDMVDGDFVFDVATTTTPNAKSLTFRLQYSLTGLDTLTGGDEQ
jgi:phage tail sheath protein FI